VDTVARAAAGAGLPQPFAELGLTRDEYEKIVATLVRRPTGAELALCSVMWSEHCSYKSSQDAPAAVRGHSAARRAAHGHRAQRRRGRHRPGLRGHVQDRVAQPPIHMEPYQGSVTIAISVVLVVLGVQTSVDKVVDDVDNVANDVTTNVLLAMPGAVRARG
jgi:phosphoribosylformylglycinamidine synthase subunit PurL